MNNEQITITSKTSWLDMRRQDVTASQVAALFGCHPYLTPLALYQQKRGENGQQGDNVSMRRGRIMELTVAEAVKEENPEWAPIIVKANEYWRLPDMKLGATPDFYIGTPGAPGCGILEAKTVSPEKFDDWGGNLPLHYSLQCLVQMMCSGAAWSTCAVLVMNRSLDLHLYAVPRHAAAEAKIAEAVARFWASVEAGEQPPPVMPQDRKTLAEMFRSDTGETIDLSGNNLLPELLDERRGLKAAYRAAETRIAEIDDEVKLAMGTAAIGTLPGWRITWRSTERKEFTVPAKTVRTLRIAKNGDNHDDR